MTLTSLFPYPPISKLKILPLREQPAYRVRANAAACSLSELLATVIGGAQQIEIAEALLARFNGDLTRIYHAHTTQIASIHGLGESTAIRLKAALSLGLRLCDPHEERPTVQSPQDAAALVQHEMSLLEQEYLRVIVLNTRNQVLEIVEVYHGSVNSSQVRIAEILKPAVERMAPAMIIVHNHPSGDPSPSSEDISLTRSLVEAGKLMDISILDHLIIGKGSFTSLKEKRLGF
ncbi:MAG: DNA repair protein RadC [Anaerolineae bacterium]|jgi:DNA repair protein RadC|nr:DNA repair protein RadC [Anaerolineae bacterium]